MLRRFNSMENQAISQLGDLIIIKVLRKRKKENIRE